MTRNELYGAVADRIIEDDPDVVRADLLKNLSDALDSILEVGGTNYNLNARIVFTELGARGNPKRPNTGAYELYAVYGKGGLTVADYLKAAKNTSRPNVGHEALVWDVAHGFITIDEELPANGLVNLTIKYLDLRKV